ncbi:MAG: 4Fe-4S dicluster domain-containing protein [Deltaproteobacteria bacterium]|jgi:ferredoxin|nr:4Fe-4S dicluster domain-containing protein [Deltaproteobacteria bacterium]
MEASSKFIARTALAGWLGELSARFRVWAPRREGRAVLYRPFDPQAPEDNLPELDKKPTESAKHIIFPRSEPLINFRRKRDPEHPGQFLLDLRVPEAPGPSLIFGLPPCDARGFMVFDPVYNGSGTDGQARDIYYLRRRAAALLIVRSCSRTLSTCFCNWVGGAPDSAEGADILASEAEDGFLLEPVSSEGAAALDSGLLVPADENRLKAAQAARDEAKKTLKPAPDISGAGKALLERFEDAAFWKGEAAHCLSCGICTFLCPTCYCFNVTDETAGANGVRLRSWDACMTPLFTLEASGHNPRQDKAARLKNRIGHKFSYYPELHEARFACVGCGRCIKSCPSGVDIRRIVTDSVGLTQSPKPKAAPRNIPGGKE